ncbi:MAG TPA: hypothetical protein VM677_20005 [Actinokineospora sp.]|nr:hypothetical protein [Actinokineospora sp.]
MSGDIWITKQLRWPVNNSLYHWVLEYLIDHVVTDADALAELEEIRDDNIGIVVADDFTQPVRATIVTALRDDLVPDAEKRLPELTGREGFLDALRRLADLAAEDTPREHASQ